MTNSTQRTNWRRHWLTSIEYFSNLMVQRERWLDREETNPHWSYVEIMCEYFDDCGLQDGYGHAVEAQLMSEEELGVVVGWHERLHVYKHPTGDDWDSAAVLNDAKWIELCTEARELVDQLLAIIGDPAERALLQ